MPTQSATVSLIPSKQLDCKMGGYSHTGGGREGIYGTFAYSPLSPAAAQPCTIMHVTSRAALRTVRVRTSEMARLEERPIWRPNVGLRVLLSTHSAGSMLPLIPLSTVSPANDGNLQPSSPPNVHPLTNPELLSAHPAPSIPSRGCCFRDSRYKRGIDLSHVAAKTPTSKRPF